MSSENNNAPDSWDQDTNEQQMNDIQKNLTALNVNAPVFVPGQNPYAQSFVPSGGRMDAGDSGTDYLIIPIRPHWFTARLLLYQSVISINSRGNPY